MKDPGSTSWRRRRRLLAVPAVFTLCLLLAATLVLKGQWVAVSGGGSQADSDLTPYIGVNYVPLSHEAAARYGVEADVGVLLTDVAEDGPARAAGLRRGDILLAMDSTPLTRSSTVVSLLLGRRPGARIGLQVLRDGRAFTADLTVSVRR